MPLLLPLCILGPHDDYLLTFCPLPCRCYMAIFTLSLTPSASEKQCSRSYDDAISFDVFAMFLRFTEHRLLSIIGPLLLYLLLRQLKFRARVFMYQFVKHSYSETRGHLIGSLLIIILDFKGPDTYIYSHRFAFPLPLTVPLKI